VLQPSNSNFSLNVSTSAVTGKQILLTLNLTAGGGFAQRLDIPVQLGTPQSTDPLGPESYGYYAYDNTDLSYTEAPAYSWVELDSAYDGTFDTTYALYDDTVKVVGLPFTFTYYGAGYDSISICSNGYISFNRTWMAEFRNWNLPSALGPPSIVAPFWDDLKADTSAGKHTAQINVFTRYDALEGRFTIEWSRCINRYGYENLSDWKRETFEMVLFDPAMQTTLSGDGEILFQYYEVHDVDANNNFATVGIEDDAHRRGLQYVYSNTYPSAAAPLAAGRAIKITTDPPVHTTQMIASGSALRFEAPQPNPANPGTMLQFTLPRAGRATLALYNTLGARVALLANNDLAAGTHRLTLNGGNMASGLYFAVLRFEGEMLTQKVLILK
jgi:hypothetical protein